MSKYLILALVALAVQEPARACSQLLGPAKIEFDRSIYVFEGRVVGFASDSLTHADGGYPAWFWEGTEPPPGTPMAGAVLIEPIVVVNTPRRAAQFAVFPAGLGAMCEPVYSTEIELAGRFVVGGARVRGCRAGWA